MMRHRLWSHRTTARLLQTLQQRRHIQKKSGKLMYTDLADPMSKGYENWSVERLATAWTAPSVIASEHAAVQKVLRSFDVDGGEEGGSESKKVRTKSQQPKEKPATATNKQRSNSKQKETTAPVDSQLEPLDKNLGVDGFKKEPIEIEEELEVKGAKTTRENHDNLPASDDPTETDSTMNAKTKDEDHQPEPVSTAEVSAKKLVQPEPLSTVEVHAKNIVDAVETLAGEEDKEEESPRQEKAPWWSSKKKRKT